MATRLFIRRERTRGVQPCMKWSPARCLHCGVDKQQVTGIKWQMCKLEIVFPSPARKSGNALLALRLMYQLTIKGKITYSASSLRCIHVITQGRQSPKRGFTPYIGLLLMFIPNLRQTNGYIQWHPSKMDVASDYGVQENIHFAFPPHPPLPLQTLPGNSSHCSALQEGCIQHTARALTGND